MIYDIFFFLKEYLSLVISRNSRNHDYYYDDDDHLIKNLNIYYHYNDDDH